MAITSRPYGGDADLERMRAFLIAAWRETGPRGGYFHVGDLLWGRYMHADFPAPERIRLWEGDGGELLGFAWFFPPAEVETEIAPRLRGSETEADLLDAMLAWADERRRGGEAAEGASPRLQTSALAGDAVLNALLAARGFGRAEHAALLVLTRDLTGSIPEPVLPPGFGVRAVGGEGEFAERVDIHREVWDPSRVTLEAYRALRQVKGYEPALDVVAVAPDGRFAAYALGWLDPVNKVAEFEPVGTRAAYRGRGLGKATLFAAMRRMHELGAETALVYSYSDREPACRLYASVGFREVDRYEYYEK